MKFPFGLDPARLAILILAMVAAMALTTTMACGDDDDDDDDDAVDDDTGDDDDDDDTMDDDTMDDDDDDDDTETADIRVLHGAPNAPNVDIFVNLARTDVGALNDLPFGSGTPYLSLPADTYTFDVVPAGMESEDSVFQVADLPLEAGNSYTAAAIGLVGEQFTVIALVDDRDVDSGMAKVRAVHAGDGVGAVDIGVGSSFEVPLFADLEFGDASEYAEVPADDYTLGVDVNNDGEADLTYDVSLSDGDIVTAFAVLDGEDVNLLAYFEDGTTATIAANAK
ncbi:MAG: DUF4397 domain-containing protein [Deltaproteobacteria bacterium]|nr:DUF4397 domain-containing protein [Deltaproteobacteria bacterium]MCB9489625.1 DUF4397 domain-containing protein [Deltaproteobacteria bacterium]